MINLMLEVFNYYGAQLVLVCASAVIVGASACLVAALHLSVRQYRKRIGKEYKPGYYHVGTCLHEISHIDVDAYEQIV